MTKFTPGPWSTDLKVSSQAGRVVIEPDVAIVYVQSNRYDSSQSKQRIANARLIATAPELLEALEWVIQCTDGDLPQGTYECLENARAVIAKATGE